MEVLAEVIGGWEKQFNSKLKHGATDMLVAMFYKNVSLAWQNAGLVQDMFRILESKVERETSQPMSIRCG